MNKNLSNKIIAIGMFAILLLTISKFAVKNIDVILHSVMPVANATDVNTSTPFTTSNNAPTKTIFNLFEEVKAKVEFNSTDIYFKNSYVELNTLFQTSMGRHVFQDKSLKVVKLDNGYLSFVRSKDKHISLYAKRMVEFKDFLDERNTELLYIQAPFKINKYDPKLPIGLDEYSNENADEFLKILDGKVNYIDMREEIEHSEYDYYDCFFKTDHHWTPEAAFWAFTQVSKKLSSDYGFDLHEQAQNLQNYDIRVFEDWFLGSQGKRIGTLAAGVEDISLITPNFETDLTFAVPSRNIYKTGTFARTLIDYSQIKTKDLYEKNPYGAYMGGDLPLISITNNLNPDGKRVLLIKDSFAWAFGSFLTAECSQLDIIDLRHYQDQSLTDYLEENDYDTVMFLYSPDSLYCSQFIFETAAEMLMNKAG